MDISRNIFLRDLADSMLVALSAGVNSDIITGDFNDRCCKWDGGHRIYRSEVGNKLRDLCTTMGVSQLVNSPTHIDKSGRPDHILDLLITNNSEQITYVDIMSPILNCDHCPESSCIV